MSQKHIRTQVTLGMRGKIQVMWRRFVCCTCTCIVLREWRIVLDRVDLKPSSLNDMSRQSKKNWPHLPRSCWASQACARCGDAERMFSLPLAEFMDRKGYTEEAKYIYAVNGWRRAADERGLSSLQVNAVAFQPRGQQVSFHTSIILIM